MFKFITHRPLWANILAAIVIALIIFFIFIFSLNWLTHHSQSKSVPQVLGKTFDEATKILEDGGFEVQIQDSLYIDTARPLVVLKQIPDADELVKVNRTVYLTINRFVPPMIEMPNLVGYSFRSAEMALKNANLRVGDTSFKADFAKNAVLEQRIKGNPIKPGEKIRMGTRIDLVLGSGVGDRQYVVPNLVGKTYCDAKLLLESMGISFGVIDPANAGEDICNWYIYRQSPSQYDDYHNYRYIRSGQLMDVWLQAEKPATDSITAPAVEPEQ